VISNEPLVPTNHPLLTWQCPYKHPTPPRMARTNVFSHAEDSPGPLLSLLNTSPTYTTHFDMFLCVENPCGAPQLSSDMIRMRKRGISPHRSPFNGSALCITRATFSSTTSDPLGHPPPSLMQIALSIVSLGDDQRGLVYTLPLALRTMQHNMLKRVVDLSSSPSMLESGKVAPLLVSSPTQDDVYEGVGEPTFFSPTCSV